MTYSPPPPSCSRSSSSEEPKRHHSIIAIKITNTSSDKIIDSDPEASSANQPKELVTSDSEDELDPLIPSDDLERGLPYVEIREEATAHPESRISHIQKGAHDEDMRVREIILIPVTLLTAFVILEVQTYTRSHSPEYYCRHSVLRGTSEFLDIGTLMTAFVGFMLLIHHSCTHEPVMYRAGFTAFVWVFVCLLTAGVLGLGIFRARHHHICERVMENLEHNSPSAAH